MYHDGTHILSLHPDLSSDHLDMLDNHSTYRELGFLNSSLPDIDFSLIEASYRSPGNGLSTLDKFEKLFVENRFLINPYLCSSQWEELSLIQKIDVINDVAIDMLGEGQVISDNLKANIIDELDFDSSDFNSGFIYDILEFIEVGDDYYVEKLLRIQGAKSNDVLYGTMDRDSIFGGSGDDIIEGFYGEDKLIGNTGHDSLFGGNGTDLLKGGPGNDVIDGGKGDDNIFGGSGDDLIKGGKGDDILSGGTGSDKFKKNKGDDTIVDFEFGIDVLKITPAGAIFELQNGGTLITHDSGSLFLEGVELTSTDQLMNQI